MVELAVLASVVFAFGLVSRRLERTILTPPRAFVTAGVLLGPTGLGLVEIGFDDHTVLLLGEIVLALVLFTDASRIRLSALRQNEVLAPALARYRDATLRSPGKAASSGFICSWPPNGRARSTPTSSPSATTSYL